MCPKVYVPPILTNISDALIQLKMQQLHKEEIYTRFYPAILSNHKYYIIIYVIKQDEFRYKRVKYNPSRQIHYVRHSHITEDMLFHVMDLLSHTVKQRIDKKTIKEQAEHYYVYTKNPLCGERNVTNLFY